jgi:hypothetical protein
MPMLALHTLPAKTIYTLSNANYLITSSDLGALKPATNNCHHEFLKL